MQVTHTAKTLAAFEDEIASLFMDKRILAPVHLSGGNEDQLIGIFREHVQPEDWICCTWRSHLHCLLKGVPVMELKQAILDGRSISLCFPEYKIFSSAIAGGTAPIAVGLALAIKKKKENRKVVCFIGDMSSEMGITIEAMKYAVNFQLPLLWVVENNGKSVNTDTARAWGGRTIINDPSIIHYEFHNRFPHVGCGKWVQF